MIIFLDTGVLGLVTHPAGGDDATACQAWMKGLLEKGLDFAIPEIADYELRRELIRASKPKSIARLDALAHAITYFSLSTETMRKAAELWAQVRNLGKPTASDEALDADVILGAQAQIQSKTGREVIIATTNVGHLKQFGDARTWSEIP